MNNQKEFHPVADVFPLMTEEEFANLCEDIRINGLREEIWLWEDRIVDGRNRYNACQTAGVEPRFRCWSGEGSLVAFVVSLNLKRRHLSESQRAMVAARLATMGEGRPRKTPSIEGVFSQTDAAKMLNVSTASVERASKVINEGVLDLAERVESGELSVSRAAEIANQPATKQKRILARRGSNRVVNLASKLKVEASLKKARSTHDVCLVCNPLMKEEISQEKFVAFLEVAAQKLPARFARYLLNNIEEIEEMDAADEMPDLYERILCAIDAGHQTVSEIQKFTRIEKEVLVYTLGCMKGASIEQVAQGGKSEAARGGRKMLWQRKAPASGSAQLKTDFRDDEESAGSLLFGLNLGFSL